jgi:hypothetical protein
MSNAIPDRRRKPIKATIYNVTLEDVPASKALHVISLGAFSKSRNLDDWLFDIGYSIGYVYDDPNAGRVIAYREEDKI